VPFIAICPHCQASRFRAPSKKRGTFTTCPKCGQDFLLLPGKGGTAKPLEYRLPPLDAEEEPVEVMEESLGHEQTLAAPEAKEAAVPSEPAEVPAERADQPPPAVGPPTSTPPPQADYALRLALVALGLFGTGVVASQFPYGRYVAVPVAGLGLLLAALSLLGLERRRWVGLAGAGLNALALLLVVALPGWLGLSTHWTPATNPDAGPKPVTAVGREDGQPVAADWVDARAAVWEQGDVRIAVTGVTVGPRDPAARRPDLVLRIGLKLTNVGVARAIEFAGWPVTPQGGPTLTTAGGESFPHRPAADRAEPATVRPGKSAEAVVAFAAPDKPTEDLRLELPAAAFGGTDPVRFRIPRAMVAR
jgi:hypothetical protein